MDREKPKSKPTVTLWHFATVFVVAFLLWALFLESQFHQSPFMLIIYSGVMAVVTANLGLELLIGMGILSKPED